MESATVSGLGSTDNPVAASTGLDGTQDSG
jgi:hypothetical protein